MPTPTIGPPPMLLTLPEAARELACSRRSLYALRAAGKLRLLKLGRGTRVARAELERFVAAAIADAGVRP